MRNQEAARYARWSAFAAGLVVLLVAGVYCQRAVRVLRLRRNLPAIVSAVIQQRSADFSYSDVEQGHTVFTVRASHATQYKDQNRALLQDVWITIYGRDGDRNDNIHTRECSYEPLSGAIRCQGEVQIKVQNNVQDGLKDKVQKNVQNANAAKRESVSGAPAAGPESSSLEVKTSDLSFDRETGEAATPNPVEFQFSTGSGRGVGVTYSTRDSIIRVEHRVELKLTASERTNGLPVNISGNNLEIRRNDHAIVLAGSARAEQGARQLSSDRIVVDLDDTYRAQRAVAEGHVSLHSNEQGAKLDVFADRFVGMLSPEGWVENLAAEGNVQATRHASGAVQQLSAAHVKFAMFPQRNSPQEMIASGAVAAESQQGNGSQTLRSDSLRLTFSAPQSPTERFGQTENSQRIKSAETLAPATIESKSGNEITTLHAAKFLANTAADGRFDQLLGRGGVQIRRQIAGGDPQVGSSAELSATFDGSGQWKDLEQTGHVLLQQADRQATATHARMVRATGQITLDGSPVLLDAMSRTSAAAVVINQTTGELHATGGVVSTYVSGGRTDGVGLGSGPSHISADSVSGSTAGHITYLGRARLWQGEAVLDADQIELWRDDMKLQATGHVLAIIPQSPGSTALPSVKSSNAKPSASFLWQVRAPVFTFWSTEGKAHLSGGVSASSTDESIESRTLDVFLTPSSSILKSAPDPGAPSPTAPATPMSAEGRRLSRVLAQGAVIVRQGDRRGEAEQAEYTAADGKFVLSGGQPTLINASSDTTTGHSLTFFVANDTILIDSKEGSRTMTRHRVEK